MAPKFDLESFFFNFYLVKDDSFLKEVGPDVNLFQNIPSINF